MAATMTAALVPSMPLPSISELLARRSSASVSSHSVSPPELLRYALSPPEARPVAIRHSSLPATPRAGRESSAVRLSALVPALRPQGLDLLCNAALAESLPTRSSLRPVPTRVHSRSTSPYARPVPMPVIRDADAYIAVPGVDGAAPLPAVIVAQIKGKRAIEALEGCKPILSTSHVERLEVWQRCPIYACVGHIVPGASSRHCACPCPLARADAEQALCARHRSNCRETCPSHRPAHGPAARASARPSSSPSTASSRTAARPAASCTLWSRARRCEPTEFEQRCTCNRVCQRPRPRLLATIPFPTTPWAC